ncbi:ABC transporter permease [Crateriforma conspicua]|uniref:ABC transporter permease n=1 Tax=Crateriforma conspicua TaxID=2527996 RepID=UPI00118CA43B|nr:ABC transporter permease [Crateriforma conspicua]QDV62091.1 Ribose transport system permease protein RbsC [Crateriforma conspicua]
MMPKHVRNVLVQYGGLLAVLAVIVAVFSFQSQNFFQHSTLVSIANQIPDLTFIAVGMTLVLIVGGIDLSVGSLLALSSAVLGSLMVDHDWSLGTAAVLCLATGAACGLVNGAIAIGFRIPSFIVTLGMLEMARGATKVVTDSQTKYIGSAVEAIGQPLPGLLLSPAFLAALACVTAGQFLLTRTVFGRYCVAIGTNEEAVRMSGIRTAPYAMTVFVISGLMCGMAALAQTSRLSSADPNAAIGIELSAIAACVIGGTSLMGGRGSVISSFIGVLIIAVLQTGLAQIGVSDANKQIITGAVIVIAVLLDALRSRWDPTRP